MAGYSMLKFYARIYMFEVFERYTFCEVLQSLLTWPVITSTKTIQRI
jgi:hypothetical protein